MSHLPSKVCPIQYSRKCQLEMVYDYPFGTVILRRQLQLIRQSEERYTTFINEFIYCIYDLKVQLWHGPIHNIAYSTAVTKPEREYSKNKHPIPRRYRLWGSNGRSLEKNILSLLRQRTVNDIRLIGKQIYTAIFLIPYIYNYTPGDMIVN